MNRRIRPYFQCLTFLGDLFECGLRSFNHSQTSGYYFALLHATEPATVPLNESATAYQELVSEGVMQVAAEELGEGFLASEDEGEVPEVPRPGARAASASGSNSSTSSSDSSSSSSDDSVVAVAVEEDEAPDMDAKERLVVGEL